MSEPLNRAITACSRCRSRKTKCDRTFPQCGSCAKAGLQCEALDPATGRNIPRSYVAHLEEKIAALERQLAEVQSSTGPVSPLLGDRHRRSDSVSTGGTSRPLASPALEAAEADKQLSFAKMMFTAVSTPTHQNILEQPKEGVMSPANLPVYGEMIRLRQVYMNHSNPQVYILSHEATEVFIQNVYGKHGATEKVSRFFVHIIAAIALAKTPSDTLTERHHASAMLYLPLVFKTASRLLSLQAMLLLSVYGTNRPSTPGIWYTLGIASRLITDLGLESFQPKRDEQGQVSEEDEEKCRSFWAFYSLERQICVYLSRPVAISDNVIHIPFPPRMERTPLYFCKLRILQSEIQRILHHSDTLPRQYATLDFWRSDMHARLQQWEFERPKTPQEGGSDFQPMFLKLNYDQTLLLLHGFSTNLSITVNIVLASAKAIVDAYSALWRIDAVNFIWLAIHNSHVAASSFLYALLQSNWDEEKVRVEFASMRRTVEDMLVGMQTRCPASAVILELFEEVVRDVEERIPLMHPSEAKLDNLDGGTMDFDMDFMINNASTKALWADFVGDDFVFGPVAGRAPSDRSSQGFSPR